MQTWSVTAEGGISACQPALALQSVRLLPEVQALVLMLQGCNVVAVSQNGLTQPNFAILDVCLMVTPTAAPDVKQVPHTHPAQGAHWGQPGGGEGELCGLDVTEGFVSSDQHCLI